MNHLSNYVPIKQNDISNFVNRKISHQPKTHFPGYNKILLKNNNDLPAFNSPELFLLTNIIVLSIHDHLYDF